MNKSKVFALILVLLFLLQVVTGVVAMVNMAKLDMLPDNLAVPLVILVVLVWLLTAVLMFWDPWDMFRGIVRRVIAGVLAILMAAGSIVVSVVAKDVYDTFDEITNQDPPEEYVSMMVHVRKDDAATGISDTRNYRYGIVQYDNEDETWASVAKLEEKLNATLRIVRYDNLEEMIFGLLDGTCDAVLIYEGYIEIIEDEEEGYPDYVAGSRELYQVQLKDEDLEDVSIPTEETVQIPTTTEPTEPSYDLPDSGTVINGAFAVYISGSDSRKATLPMNGRNDVNILAIVNPTTKQILLINTPRDYYVYNPAKKCMDKLTHCGNNGVNNSMGALADLYDVEIKYYARMNFKGLITLVDAIGGVAVYSEKEFSAMGVPIKKGYNLLNGGQALCFARERKHLAGGDNARGQNQMILIKAIVAKMTSGSTIISNYTGILSSLTNMFKTNMSLNDISLLVKMQLSDMASWEVYSYAATGKNGKMAISYLGSAKRYVMIPHESSVNKAKAAIDKLFANELITSADVKK